MIKEYINDKVTWIDMEEPTLDEVHTITERFALDPEIANELKMPSTSRDVRISENYLYFMMHFPFAKNDNTSTYIASTQEVDFVIGKDFIITTRFENVDSLNEFSKIFEVDTVLDKSSMSKDAGYIFYFMIRHLYKSIQNSVAGARERIKEAEKQIFNGNEKAMVLELSKLNRLILSFKEAVGHHAEVLESFTVASNHLYEKKFGIYAEGLLSEYEKVKKLINNTQEYINELRATNDSLLNTKQNEIMKYLTVVAVIFLPMSLVSNIFGMGATGTPIIGTQNDFWVIMAVMSLITLTLYVLFKIKKWL